MNEKSEKNGERKRSHRMYDPDHPRPMKHTHMRHKRFPRRFMLDRMEPHMMRRDHIYREMKDLFILSALDEKKEGLSGTQLQDLHELPRGNLMRSLVELENRELIEKNNEKIYKITEKGQGFLEELKGKIAERNIIIDDIAPMERYANPLRRNHHRERLIYDLELLKDKEELIDYFRGMRARITRHRNHLEHRLKKIDIDKKELDDLIQQIESADESSIDEVKEKIREKFKKKKNSSSR
ncbi:hypothetical protein DSAG12_03794 [Promethearchaeum syntrophicum]|uniref:Uncharacterized protein n=1 Tax=Promethearchaeum syntrophicum TaxID=2594042 RepID=A0A5B9DGV3_9ARCH|nr:hypothetical protein [Candidatus Prometheoarchaeum syntrophicum]QEE17956.1 hypothetical protein DSAG12_03794 [Candidatus Prometheoarchaeum syntrophicum]